MIRTLFWAGMILVTLLALLAAARFDRGYVLIVFPPWRIEMSFILALVATFGLYVLTYALFKLLRVALRLPAEVRARRERRLRDRSADDLSRAVAALLSGQEAQARLLADAALRKHRQPLAALVAARAAIGQGDDAGARTYLDGMAGNQAGELIAARQSLARELAEAGPPPA
jgi:HemY protein